jgi:putative nucleotidyltransferase with HDIG domain
MDLVGIRTATLRAEVPLAFDLFLLISGKHLLYVRREDHLERERLARLQNKNVRQVYIRKDESLAYTEYLQINAKKALNDFEMPLGERAEIISGQTKAAVEDLFDDPHSYERYQRVQTAAAHQVALLFKFPEALEFVLGMAAKDKTVYQHSVNVATLAIAVANILGYAPTRCSSLGLGGLLHDIGKSGLEPTDPDDFLTQNEQYLQHTRRAANLLVGKNYVSPEVLDIILFHEERVDGKGFPAGIKAIETIYQVVGLANMYDRYVTVDGLSPVDAYTLISRSDPNPYEKRLIDILYKVLRFNNVL